MKKKKVIIIGAGLAGLSAAYKLSKSGGYSITVLEANDYVGGRIKSIKLGEHHVDLGGFIVFSWYKEFIKIAKELKLKLTPIRNNPNSPTYVQVRPGGPVEFSPDSHFPILQRLRVQYEVMKCIFKNKFDLAHPALDIYGGKTVREYIQKILGNDSDFEHLVDTLNQGYCYPDISDYKLSIWAPFVYKTYRFNGVGEWNESFDGQTSIMPEALAKFIKKKGGKVITKQKVTKIEKGKVHTANKTYKADIIICAQTVDNKLFTKLIGQKPNCSYTRFLTAVVELKKPASLKYYKGWEALFVAPIKNKGHQILSYINLCEIVKGISPNYMLINIRINKEEKVEKRKTFLKKNIQKQINSFFKKNTVQAIPVIHDWKKTMPVADESFIHSVRKVQGKDNIYFAGDYLGAPSMETSLITGTRIAERIIKNNLK